MLDTREIHSLTDFLRNHEVHVARLKQTRAPEVLTVNGKAEVVVQDAASYQAMLDRLHHMEASAAIQEGMASAERGALKPAAQVLPRCRRNMGFRVSLSAPAEADAGAAFEHVRRQSRERHSGSAPEVWKLMTSWRPQRARAYATSPVSLTGLIFVCRRITSGTRAQSIIDFYGMISDS